MAELDLGKIGYEVEVDDKQYHRKLSGMEKSASSTGKNIMKMLSFVAGVTFFKKFVQAASDLEEVENKFATVFAAVRKEADKTRKHLQDFYGLGKKQSATMLGNTGDLLTGVGFDAKTSLELSKQVQEMAVDLASFSNYAGGASGASEALTKALLGETEMMKSLGVTLNQNSSRFKELMRENKEAKGMTEMQAKAYTVLTMTIEQSKNAMGDYARTADQFANRYRKGVVDAKDAVAEMGKQLIPVAHKILNVFSSLLKVTNLFNGGLLRTVTYFAMIALAGKKLNQIRNTFKNKMNATWEAEAAKQAEAVKIAETKKANAIIQASNLKRTVAEQRNYLTESLAAKKAAKEKLASVRKGKKVTNSMGQTRVVVDQKAVTLAQQEYNQTLRKQVTTRKSLVKVTRRHVAATRLVRIHTNKASIATATNTMATNTNAVAQGTMTRAVFFTKGALKGLWATMLANPFTAIFMIGGMVLSLIMSIIDGINQADQEARQKLQQNLESARQQRQALETQNADTDKLIARLKEINSKEKLNNIERREQARILSQLKSRHKDFNAEIDDGTGKINGLTKAMQELAALQEKGRQDAFNKEKEVTKSIISRMEQDNADLETATLYSGQFKRFAKKINDKKIAENNKKIAILKEQLKNNILKQQYKDEIKKDKPIADAQASHNKYKSGFTNDHKNDYTRNTEAEKAEHELAKKHLETLKKAGVYKGLQYIWELAKLKSIHAIKQGELELDKKRTEEARKKAQIEQQAYEADQQRRQEQNELRINQDLEYKKLETEAWSDGKLTDDERLKLKEKEIEATKAQIEQQKKHAEQLEGMAKKQAQSGILSLETGLGKLNGEIASMMNKNSNQNPDKVVQAQGGFLAGVVKTMGANQENHAKSTAQHTKDIASTAKQIATKMDQPNNDLILDE